MAYADIQSSFTSGELSPNLFARVDLDKYAAGAALMRNFFADFRGGASNRAGTRFIGFLQNAQDKGHLLPFIVDSTTGYVLEFGELYCRPWFQGTPYAAVTTPYHLADLIELKYAQSADVMTLTHPNYPPAELSRTGIGTFTYAPIVIGTQMPSPQFTAAAGKYTPGNYFSYAVTAVSLDGKEESLASVPIIVESASPLTGDNNHVIDLVWSAPAQPTSYYNVFKYGPIDRSDPITSIWGYIGSTLAPSFVDNGIAPDFSKTPPTNVDPWSGGQITSIAVNAAGSGYTYGAFPGLSYLPLTFTGGGGTGAAGYAIINNGSHTVIGAYLTSPGKNYTSAPTVTATGDGGSGATFTCTVSNAAPKYPVCVAYFDQRRVFGGGNVSPENIDFSQPGNYNNFNRSQISQASDAINASLSAREVNIIKNLVPMSTGLVGFTSGGAFLLSSGGSGAPLTPTTINVKAQASTGSSDVPPLIINYDILYVQNKGSIVRDLAFNYYLQSYQGSDRSMLANHLFFNHTIIDWAWSEVPYKLVWCVREDGIALSLTYVPDQEIYAWARHDTQGQFISTVCIPEGSINAVYFIVKRYLPGIGTGDPCADWYYCLERLDDRTYTNVEEAWFVDCGAKLDKNYPDFTVTPYYTDSSKTQLEICAPTQYGPGGYTMYQPDGGITAISLLDVVLSSSYSGTVNVKINGVLLNGDPDSTVNGISMWGAQYNGGSVTGIPVFTGSDGYLHWDPTIPGHIDYFVNREADVTTFSRDTFGTTYLGRALFDNNQYNKWTTTVSDHIFSITSASNKDSGYWTALPIDWPTLTGEPIPYPDNIGGGNLVDFRATGITPYPGAALSQGASPAYYYEYTAGQSNWLGGVRNAGGPPATTDIPVGVNTPGNGGRLQGSATLAAGQTLSLLFNWNLRYTGSGNYRNMSINSIAVDSGAGYVDIPLTQMKSNKFNNWYQWEPVPTVGDGQRPYVISAPVILPGPFTDISIGDVVHIAGGKAVVNTIIDSWHIICDVVLPITQLLPDDPDQLVGLQQAPGTWDFVTPVQTVGGLGHLEAKEVVALADGEVVSGLTVSGGSVTLPRPASNIIVGLSYICQLQTLYLDISGGAGTVQGKRKFLPAVTLRLDSTRGLYVGNTFDDLYPVKDQYSPITTPESLISGDIRTNIGGNWTTPANVCIQTTDPLPASVLGVIAEVVEGDTGR